MARVGLILELSLGKFHAVGEFVDGSAKRCLSKLLLKKLCLDRREGLIKLELRI